MRRSGRVLYGQENYFFSLRNHKENLLKLQQSAMLFCESLEKKNFHGMESSISLNSGGKRDWPAHRNPSGSLSVDDLDALRRRETWPIACTGLHISPKRSPSTNASWLRKISLKVRWHNQISRKMCDFFGQMESGQKEKHHPNNLGTIRFGD
jgi:hypothetical protein